MGKLTVIVVMVFVLMMAGGALFLAFYDYPVPATPVEKVLPDARFPK
jgi:hypothetical protein